MLKQIRQAVVNNLWEKYRDTTPQMQQVEEGLQQKGIAKLPLDHFAIIDLPGPRTGIGHLHPLFSAIGYQVQGRDYLPDKQNDFVWMTEVNSHDLSAHEVLPQVVVADFRLDELPIEIRKIIVKYAQQARPSPVVDIQKLADRALLNDKTAAKQVVEIMTRYLAGKDWPLPTQTEWLTVKEFNELLAWVLIFGRKPNHFTLAVHLLSPFAGLLEFHQFIERDLQLSFNHRGGMIKGGEAVGIAQSSTINSLQTIQLADGQIDSPTGFVEFVWRFPHNTAQQPLLWKDYFTGFIAQQANRVIESLYIPFSQPSQNIIHHITH